MSVEIAEASEEEEEEEKLKVSRQEFLNLAWLASLGILTISIGGATIYFSMPRFEEGEFGGLVPVGTVADLPEAGAGPENFPKVKFWLINTGQGVKAIYKVCPHLGCLFGWNNQEKKFICPCHGSQFTPEGDYINGPSPRSLDYFDIQVVDPDSEEVVEESDEESGILRIPDGSNLIIKVDTGSKTDGEAHA